MLLLLDLYSYIGSFDISAVHWRNIRIDQSYEANGCMVWDPVLLKIINFYVLIANEIFISMEKSFEVVARISDTSSALWFASSLQPLCPRDRQADAQPSACHCQCRRGGWATVMLAGRAARQLLIFPHSTALCCDMQKWGCPQSSVAALFMAGVTLRWNYLERRIKFFMCH